MRKKLFVILFSALMVLAFFAQFYHVQAATLMDYYTTEDTAYIDNIQAMTFLSSGNYIVSSIAVKVQALGATGTIECDLETTVAGVPSDTILAYQSTALSDLPAGAPDWFYFNFTYAVTASQTYAIVLNYTGSDSYIWRGGDTAGDGKHYYYSGGVWTPDVNMNMLFEVYGDIPSPTWSGLSATETGLTATAQVTWQDTLNNLDYWCMETNNTADGSLTNTTFTAFSSNPETVSSTITFQHFGGHTEYRFHANNTANLWGTTDWAYISNPTWVNDTTSSNTLEYYLNTETHEVGTVTAYKITDDLSYENATATQTLAGNNSLVYGFRVWLVNREGTTTELTGGYPTGWIYRDSNGSGYNTVSVGIAESTFPSMCRALEVSAYVKFNLTGSWVNMGNFITDILDYKGTTAGSWTFQLYTTYAYNGTYTTATIYWGDLTSRSGFTSTTFVEPLPQERTIGYAWNGDWWNFATYPFTMIIGNAFYGLLLFGVGVIVYAQNRKTSTLVINLILFGGAGLFGFFIIDPAWKIIYAIGIIATAVIIYRVFR